MHPVRCFAAAMAIAAGAVAIPATSADTSSVNLAVAERGAALLQPFKRDLKQALTTGLQEGPAAAVSACKLEAPAIAARLSTAGVTMGRTSHRLRNPKNAGPAWADAVLQQYLKNVDAAAPELRELDDGRTGYVEPIRMQAMCLTCHGASLAPDLAARIEAAYPEDQATGFELGDVRGVFWVAFSEEAGAHHAETSDSHHRETAHHKN